MGRWLAQIAVGVLALAAVLAFAGWWLLRGSLPALDDSAPLPGLSAPVTVARDALGIVTIDAGNEADAMRALGYVHAQERFFEMDLTRRAPAGELSALFGPRALDVDREHRVHRMRSRVDATLATIAGNRMPVLEAYTDGVNAGLGALGVRPWPYLLLRRQPARWTVADSALTGYAMYFDLQDAGNARELALWRMRPHLPPALHALLTRDGTRWDAPLAGAVRGDASLPTADLVDLRRLPTPAADGRAAASADLAAGSNNFAVDGTLTADGRALVADDMHLGLRAPNIWFRARLRYADARAPGGRVDVAGFTLPGIPAVIVGSNTHVAWGFTNSYGDHLDWARVWPCRDATVAGAANRCDPVVRHEERIDLAGAAAEQLVVEETAWGPVLHTLPDGSGLALRWTAHLPGALNFGLADFARARDLDDALAMADRTATPTQNLVIGDRSGAVAWRLMGPIALRGVGCDGREPVESAPGGAAAKARAADAATPAVVGAGTTARTPATAGPASTAGSLLAAQPCAPWPISTAASPSLRSPQAHRLWTANNRVADGAALARMGDGGTALAARAHRIRDLLFRRTRFTERDLLAIQLDDRAPLLTGWWQLLQRSAGTAGSGEAIDTSASTARLPSLRALARVARPWQGRASIDSRAYRVVRAWRLAVHARLLDGLTAPARAALGPTFELPDVPQFEGVAWPLVQQQPEHLLPSRFACAAGSSRTDAHANTCGWPALFEDAAREVRDELLATGPLAERTWGERNTAAICHPLAGAIPVFGKRLLCMPADPLPGDGAMPRVQGPGFGASQRMVVSPGHEADGIAHMPGGQSGHPLSPFWGAGHAAWVTGAATPFLPGATRHTLRLAPVAAAR